MHSFTTVPAAARRRPGTGLLYLVLSGLLWGTGGLTGSLLIALGTGPTAVAYTLYFRGLRSAAASTAALLALLEPLTGAILAALLLAERLSATGIAGAAIIAAAVILTVQANRGLPEDVRAPTAGRANRETSAVSCPDEFHDVSVELSHRLVERREPGSAGSRELG